MQKMPALSDKLERHILSADFAVIGGGMSGICAALAAARRGSRVVLVQDRSVLGGNASSEVKMHIVGADCHGGRPGTRESGLIEELKLEDAVRNPYRCYSQWDLLLYEKVKLEPNITLLLDTTCLSCEQDPKTKAITSVYALRNSTDDLYEIRAPFFADCSGDSKLAFEAGADYHVGREAKSDHGESLAQDTADKHTLGSSILITGKKHDTPQPFIAPSWIRKFKKEDLKHRPVHSYEYGYWWFEWGGQHDTIKDNEMIRHELLRIALGIWDYVKNSGNHPDSANWTLDWVGSIAAKRESRRLLGPHLLTQHDLQAGRLFEDAVAYGGWAIDIHPPQGVDVPDEPPFTPTGLHGLYTIPFGCLHSRNIPNLLFAGRNISATHAAFASTRVMATCAIMGQAIGTAVPLALESGKDLTELPMKKFQQMLLKDDAFIPNVLNEDPEDRARGTSVSASCFKEGCEPQLVVDGIARDLIGRFGPWADQKPHHWESRQLPAWIELKFKKSAEIREIHLTFDTGFQRELVLTPSNYVTSRIVRGPQPETVRDYRILAGGKVVAEVRDNYLRKRVHTLAEAVTTDTLRLEVLATQGAPEARLFEIRAY
jgi:hypothetical protein